MKTAIAIYAAALMLAIPNCANAFEYEVDMPNSGDKRFEMIRVKINNCDTKFLIKKEEFESFTKNSKALQQLVQKALQREATGCLKTNPETI